MTQPDTKSARKSGWKRAGPWITLGSLVVVAILFVVVVIPLMNRPPTMDDLKEQAGLVGKSELLIGVKDDIPGIAFRDPDTGQFTGFDIDVAYLIAADLGFQPHQVRFLVIEDEDRPKMRARDGDRYVTVDLVIAHYSNTRKREEQPLVSFSATYLYTEQSVITMSGHAPVHDLADLAGRKACTVGTSTSQTEPEKAGVTVVRKQNYGECLRALRSGEVEAVTSDAAILAGFVAADPEVLTHHDIALDVTEPWAVNTGGDEAMRDLVNVSLYCSLTDPNDRDWENAYDNHLRPLEKVNLPQPVAVDEQPQVAEEDVRGTPCE